MKGYLPLYVADYLADTAHLTTEQHGAYLLLMMHYWRTGKPIPDDDKILMNVTKLSRHKLKKFRSTLEQIFSLQDGKFLHKRIEAELRKAAEISEKRAKAGRKGGKANAPSNAKQMLTSRAKSHTQFVSNDTNKRTRRFGLFYDAYPRKKEPARARKAFEKINPDDDLLNRMLEAIAEQRAWREKAQAAGVFVPDWKHPTTWLNGGCWEDELEDISELRNGSGGSRKTLREDAEDFRREIAEEARAARGGGA